MDRFVAGDRAPSSPERAKMLACAYPTLDRPMILFQNVVEILHRSMPAILFQSLLGFEPHDGRWITGVFVGSVANLQSRRDRLAGCSFWTLRFAVYSNGVNLSRRSSCWR